MVNATTSKPNPLSGHDDASWMVLLITLAILGGFQWADPFHIAPDGILMPAMFILSLALAAAFYRRRRSDRKIVAMCVGLQQMTLFSAAGAILSYMVAAQGGAFWDARIAGWDHALGLDWIAYLDWLNRHALFAGLLKLAYMTIIPQMAMLIIVLGLGDRLAALRTAILGAMIAGLTVILLSGVMPAVAAYAHFGLHPADYPNLRPAASLVHMRDLLALRSGELRVLSIDKLEGIITFPSYHAALAIVFGWGFLKAPQAPARWAGVGFAALTLAATPIDGGHYFSDVLAGCAIAALSLLSARRLIYLRLWSGAWTQGARPLPA